MQPRWNNPDSKRERGEEAKGGGDRHGERTRVQGVGEDGEQEGEKELDDGGEGWDYILEMWLVWWVLGKGREGKGKEKKEKEKGKEKGLAHARSSSQANPRLSTTTPTD